MTDKAAEQEQNINEQEQNSAEAQQNEEIELETGSEIEQQDEVAEEPLNELEIAKKELGESKDKYLRLVAEFDNFRKRSARERVELIQTAGKDIVLAMLEVLDDCNRAEKQMEQDSDADSIKEGAKLVFHKLRNTLEHKGVTQMDSKGQDFDPDLHEAITEIPASDDSQKGKVIDVVQEGYYLNSKLIRHAKVVVGK